MRKDIRRLRRHGERKDSRQAKNNWHQEFFGFEVLLRPPVTSGVYYLKTTKDSKVSENDG